MDVVTIKNSILSGEVTLPPSKSMAHRALICSFLAGGGNVSPIISSNDMVATTKALQSIKNNNSEVDCIESGSTLRFLIPVAAALGKELTFVGSGRLPQRPLDEYAKLLPSHGVNVKTTGGLPFSISGKLRAGDYQIAGDVSSQYITGLLLALPLAQGDSAIRLTTPLQSKPYVDMTIDVMKKYSVNVFETDFGYLIKGNQQYKPIDYTVEGDWSQAAFFISAAAIGSQIKINGANYNSLQGDKSVVEIMRKMGADIEINQQDNSLVCKKSQLHSFAIDASDIPDMVPSIAVTAAFAKGKTVIYGASRLRFKESDRIKSVVNNLKAMGADVEETDDGMIINGTGYLHSAELKGYNDHRIVMAFSVAAAFLNGTTTIDDAQSINKSYPRFFEDFNSIGGNANVISNR